MLLHFDMFDVNVNINGLKLCSLLVEEDKVRQVISGVWQSTAILMS